MNNHETFPGEQQEMPKPEQKPEVSQPTDPKIPETPIENPESVPQEIPKETPPEKAGDSPKTDEAEERVTGKGSMQDSVETELKNQGQ